MTSGLLILALLGGAIASLYFLTSKLACLSLLSFGLYFYLDATLPPVPASAHVSRGVDDEAPLQAAEPEKRVVVEEKPPRPARPFWVKNNRPFWQERNIYQPDWDWRAAHSQRRVVLPEEVHAVAPASPPAREDDKPASESGSRGQSSHPVVASVLAEISMPPTLDVRTEVPQREVLRPCSHPAIRACEQKKALGVTGPILVNRARAKKPVRRALAAKKVHFDAGVEEVSASLHLQPLHQAVEGAPALVGPILYQQNVVEEIEEMVGDESTTTILNAVAEQLLPTTFQAVETAVQEQSEAMVGLEATAAPVFPGPMLGQQTSEAVPEEVFVFGSTTPTTTYTQEVTPVYEPASAPSPSPAPPATAAIEQAETTTPAPEADADLDSELLGLTADADDDGHDSEADANGESDSSVSSSVAGPVEAEAEAVSASALALASAVDTEPEEEADTTADAATSPPAANAEPEADTAADSGLYPPAADDDAASRAKVAGIRNNIDSTYTNMLEIFDARCENLEKKPTTAHYREVWEQLNKIEAVTWLPGICIGNMKEIVAFIEEQPDQWDALMAEPEPDPENQNRRYGHTVFENMCHLMSFSRAVYGKGRFEGPKHPVAWLFGLSNRVLYVMQDLKKDYASKKGQDYLCR